MVWFLPHLYNLLDQVTDYAEEKEISSTGNELEDAIAAIRNKQAIKTAEKLARERELAKVTNNHIGVAHSMLFWFKLTVLLLVSILLHLC